ncbi:MAG: hypothetical protein WDN28_09870 [Chthoniobacter sp.]
MSLLELVEEYVRELHRLGRNEKYVEGVRVQLTTMAKECRWKLVKDISAESFRAWRQRQTKSAKTLNEYLASWSSLLNWLETR